MEITYLYGNLLVIHSASIEMVGNFHKWKISHKSRSHLIRLAINNSLLFPKNILFYRVNLLLLFFFFFFLVLQTTKVNLKWPTTLQQPWTNWLAPTMWTLASVKRDLDDFRRPKWHQLVGYSTKSVQERKQKCRVPTETKPSEGRSCIQSVYPTKKSTNCCSGQLSQRTKNVSSFSIYTVQRHGGATEACSQGFWHCRLPEQKDFCDTAAIQSGQPRDILRSSSSIRTEERGRKISRTCVCKL